MKVLLVKTSSMGDVIHALSAVTDASQIIPNIQFDWVVEENFAEIPGWHSNVNQVIPIAWRRWRKNLFQTFRSEEWRKFREQLKNRSYDVIIDGQGLLKSAVITRLAHGVRCGLDFHSAREPLSALVYHHRYHVSKNQHAVIRLRKLFSQVFNYQMPITQPTYGIDTKRLSIFNNAQDYVVFIHGTSRATKFWPEEHWATLAQILASEGLQIKLPCGNAEEMSRATHIANCADHIEACSKLSLSEVAGLLRGAKAAVAVDTGLGHLAAALSVPTVSLYGPTDPALIGACGISQVHMSKNNLSLLTPQMVWEKLRDLL